MNTFGNQMFADECYNLLKQVPAGQVTTYKDIAQALGTKAYRAVGQAMKKNPNAPEVPCHRVVKSDGTIGGFVHGSKAKIILLQKEEIIIKNSKIVNFNNIRFKFLTI